MQLAPIWRLLDHLRDLKVIPACQPLATSRSPIDSTKWRRERLLQAVATILDYLDRLRDLIWKYYAEDITELRIREEMDDAAEYSSADQQLFLFDGKHDR